MKGKSLPELKQYGGLEPNNNLEKLTRICKVYSFLCNIDVCLLIYRIFLNVKTCTELCKRKNAAFCSSYKKGYTLVVYCNDIFYSQFF